MLGVSTDPCFYSSRFKSDFDYFTVANARQFYPSREDVSDRKYLLHRQ